MDRFNQGVPPVDNMSGGFVDYNDAVTQTTPISVTGGAGYVPLTNDGAGSFTNKTYLPVGITDIWDVINNEFDFSQLKLGDMIDIRLDILVTTTAPNQLVDVVLELGQGVGAYNIPFVKAAYKNAGVQSVNRYNGIYMGDMNTLNNPAQFKIKSDSNCTVVVNGWYCKIIKVDQ